MTHFGWPRTRVVLFVFVTVVLVGCDGSPPPSTIISPSAPPTGPVRYVSVSGNDANDGTISFPWRHVQFGVNQIAPGTTLYVRGGTYSETVTISISGSAIGGYLTIAAYPGENPVINGTLLTPPSGGITGLITLSSCSYVQLSGLEIRNFSTSDASATPAGIFITGSGTHIEIQSCHIHHISTSAATLGGSAGAFGLAAYGTQSAPLESLTISGNELDHLITGSSESMAINGNVANFTVSHNLIHDNNNIGIDAIGFEGTAPSSDVDQARNGEICDNTVFNISSASNPAYSNLSANGIYVDGGTGITIERNVVHNCDVNLELASEHAGRTTSHVIARNNLFYTGNVVGASIGGFAATMGGTDTCKLVNNTLYNNDTTRSHSGEFQIQFNATGNVFENNILYASSQALFVNQETALGVSPTQIDYNLYFSPVGAGNGASWIWNGFSFDGFAAWQAGTGNDAHGLAADPLFVSLSTPDLRPSSGSPANNAGINLGSTVVGTTDLAGNPRVLGAQIDLGAYEH